MRSFEVVVSSDQAAFVRLNLNALSAVYEEKTKIVNLKCTVCESLVMILYLKLKC